MASTIACLINLYIAVKLLKKISLLILISGGCDHGVAETHASGAEGGQAQH